MHWKEPRWECTVCFITVALEKFNVLQLPSVSPMFYFHRQGRMLSRLLPLFPPGARGSQAALHYALLPPSFRHTCLASSRASAILDSPGLTQSPVYYLPYMCQFPCSVPRCINCNLSVLPVCWRCSCLVLCPFPIKCLTPRTCFSSPASSPASLDRC